MYIYMYLFIFIFIFHDANPKLRARTFLKDPNIHTCLRLCSGSFVSTIGLLGFRVILNHIMLHYDTV